MPQTFVVDQGATFAGIAFLQSAPRVAFGSRDGVQESNKDGVPRWDVQVICMFNNNFGQSEQEIMKVSMYSHKNPGDGLAMFTPIRLVNLLVGVMDKTIKDKATGQDKVVGAQVWYRADEIQSAMPPANHKG